MQSLVERGTFQIDEIDQVPGWSTIDKVQHEGHLYSSKPPLLSTLAAGVSWCLKQTVGLDLRSQTDDTTHAILLVLNWLPAVASFVVFARLLRRLSEDAFVRSFALATLCFGTLVTGYATTFNNHSLGAACLIFALSPLLRLFENDGVRKRDFVAAGFWAAAVCCCELPAALLGVISFAIAARRDWKRTAVWFAIGALIPLGAYFVMNAFATGGWKPFYLVYGTDKYRFVRDGIPSYWINPHGLDRNLDSPLVYFLHCTVGHHGIFSLSPIFALMLLSWCRRTWWRATRIEPVMWLGIGLTVAVLGFYLSRTENYNYGGNTFGLRWIIWLCPLWILSLLPALTIIVRCRWSLLATSMLLAVSCYSSQLAARNPWAESWLFHQMEQAGWIDYSEPPPELPFNRKLHTWFADIPGPDHAGGWIEFASPRGGFGQSFGDERLRVSDLGQHDDANGRDVREIEFYWPNRAPSGDRNRVLLDVAGFGAGEPIEKVLLPQPREGMSQAAALAFLRGVPVARPYHAGSVRYLKTPLQKDAMKCHRAATQVTRKLADGRVVVDRCDLWLTPDVPFGVVQFELTQLDQHGEILSKKRFTAVETGNVNHPEP